MPTQETIPGRLLSVEVRAHNTAKKMAMMESLLWKLVFTIVAASFGVIATVISAAVYIGGQLQSVADLDRRVATLENR